MRAVVNMMAMAAGAVAMSASAADFQPRSCGDNDMEGLWRTVSFTEEPVGALTAMFAQTPYEYWIFNGVTTMAYATGKTELTWTDENSLKTALNSVFAASKLKGKYNYRVGHGMIQLAHDDAPWAAYKCVIAQHDSEDGAIKQGDMVWYSLDEKGPYVKRVERKLTRPQ